MNLVARVAVEKAAYSFDALFDYQIPPSLQALAQPGCRVVVPFGGGNRRRIGLVVELGESQMQELKPLCSVVDTTPILSQEMLQILQFLKERTFCTYFEALRVLLPAGIGVNLERTYQLVDPLPADPQDLPEVEGQLVEFFRRKRTPVPELQLVKNLGLQRDAPPLQRLVEKGFLTTGEQVRRRVQDEKLTMVRLTGEEPEKLTPKQEKVYDFLQQVGGASLKETCYFAAVTKGVVDKLVEKGCAEYYQRVIYRNPYEQVSPGQQEPPALSEQQQRAYLALRAENDRQAGGVSLLFGVTGSGKTQVFLKLIEHVLQKGQQALVMVPEIALTPQTIQRFHQRFGRRVAVLHSGLSLGERADEWQRIRQGQADIVVGTRSAVFAPLDRLGLIVMDEEQEHTYQSESAPRFHARDVARLRVRYHHAHLVLASATPSVESFYLAKEGRYQLVTLPERFTGSKLPDVYVIDMGSQPKGAILSEPLLAELYYNLEHRQQSILLLNRRGYSTVVQCSMCGQVASCPNCSIPLTYHAANGQLMCHYCGYTRELKDECPLCGSSYIRHSGVGTQQLQELLQEQFPQAKILRMDADTTMSRYAHEKQFARFAAGEYDMMVGTQMVAKGLDFANVTLVGVVAIDQALYADDFRGYERAFSLLTQVVGRCGRGNLPGRALIQTFSPENPVIAQACIQDYEAFYQMEIGTRRLNLYPPFCTICCVGFAGVVEEKAHQAAHWFSRTLAQTAQREYPQIPLRILDVCRPAIYRISGKFRYKLVIKCRNTAPFRALLSQVLREYYQQKAFREVSVYADLNFDGKM